MSEFQVLVTDRYSADSLAHLSKHKEFSTRVTTHRPAPDELKIANALLIRSRTKVDKELLSVAPNLKVIISATSGFDHIDIAACKERGLVVMHTPLANRQSAAEHTLLLMLATLRHIKEANQILREGKWKDSLTVGGELSGKTVGIIGLGRVGSRVAEIVQAFGAQVLAHDPYQDDSVFEKLKIARMGLTEVMAQSDILTLHVPLTPETRHIIRADTLEYAPEGIILINASRGQVVDEGALCSALETGQVAAAGLDVFENEPLARESRLRKMPNVVLTPHIGAHTEEAYQKASQEAVEKLIAYKKTGSVTDPVF